MANYDHGFDGMHYFIWKASPIAVFLSDKITIITVGQSVSPAKTCLCKVKYLQMGFFSGNIIKLLFFWGAKVMDFGLFNAKLFFPHVNFKVIWQNVTIFDAHYDAASAATTHTFKWTVKTNILNE